MSEKPNNVMRAFVLLEMSRTILNKGVCSFTDTGIPGVSKKYNDIITSIGNLERHIEANAPPMWEPEGDKSK